MVHRFVSLPQIGTSGIILRSAKVVYLVEFFFLIRIISRLFVYGMSRHEFVYDVAIDIGQSKLATLKGVGELFVVQSQEVQHGRMQVVDVYRVFHRMDPQFVDCADRSLRKANS